ncbi:MAG TPA: hypothetical protein VFF27_00765, partial [Bacteroidia bacterium]|nr:hypothetical protein [Bacteroidia bacterium]
QPPGNEGQLYSSVFSNGKPPNYVPDKSIGIGFKAGVTIGMVGKEDAFNADVGLEVQFNSPDAGGGLSLIKFTGDCFLMTSIQDRQGKKYTEVPVGASIGISYDFNNKIFHANMEVAINYSSISGKVTTVLHFEQKEWYVYIGTPSNRGYVNVIGINLSSYFMVGNKIEPMPDLPGPVAEAFGKPNNRDESLTTSAKGFAVGASLEYYAGGSMGWDFFEAYGDLSVLVGFDVMMQKYGSSYPCGLKGWYLRGQLYAYARGSVGIRGSFKVKKFDCKIADISASAILYGELPSPTFMEGSVKAHYDILGGLVNGDLDFHFETGNRCG